MKYEEMFKLYRALNNPGALVGKTTSPAYYL